MEGTAGKGFRHDLVDDCGDKTMIQATKLTTKGRRRERRCGGGNAAGTLITYAAALCAAAGSGGADIDELHFE